jgi:hypothetical protein
MCLNLRDAFEQRLVQPLVSRGSVVTFDVRVLLRLPRLDVVELDVVLSSPSRQCNTDVFRAIFTAHLS